MLTRKEMDHQNLETQQEIFEQFLEDMEDVGYEIYKDYHGRYGYVGPAAIVDNFQGAAKATDVWLNHDQLGLRLIVYPQI